MANEISLRPEQGNQVATLDSFALTPESVLGRKRVLNQVMQSVMKKDEHYGIIPGCGKKPSLLKPGAEAISSTFQLCPKYEINKVELGNGHREYEIVCNLHTPDGGFVGSGVGSCSTMEGKYRYRTGEGEVTGIPVPKAFWDSRNPQILKQTANDAGIEGDKFGTKKDDSGKWMISTHGERVEHDNPADYYNTVLKMGKKRAFVDAVLTATGASDIFTQDIEDMPEVIPGAARSGQPTQQAGRSAMDGMDQMPDSFGNGQGQQGNGAAAITEPQKRKIFGTCKGKNIGLDDLCLALSDGNSFGHAVQRVTDLTKQEASSVIEWLEAGQLDHLMSQAA
jgi:hypothetical protein